MKKEKSRELIFCYLQSIFYRKAEIKHKGLRKAIPRTRIASSTRVQSSNYAV